MSIARSLTITSGTDTLTAVENDTGLFIPGFTVVQFVLFLTAYAAATVGVAAPMPPVSVEVPEEQQPENAAPRKSWRELRAERQARRAKKTATKAGGQGKARKNLELAPKDLKRIHDAVESMNGSLSHVQRSLLQYRFPENGEALTMADAADRLHIDRTRARDELRIALSKIGVKVRSVRGRGKRGAFAPVNGVENPEELLAQTTS